MSISHQRWLVIAIVALLAVQIIFFNVIVSITLATSFNHAEQETINGLFSLLRYYISATAVELVGMVAFIAKATFSTEYVKPMRDLIARLPSNKKNSPKSDSDDSEPA